MARRLQCPECDEVFKPRQPVAAGRKVRCPECGAAFAAPDEDEDEDDSPPPRRGARRKKAKGGSATPWLVGGGVALVAVAAVVVLLLRGGSKDPPAVAGGGENPKTDGGKTKTDGAAPKTDGGKSDGGKTKAGGSGVTREKFNKLSGGMKKENVAALLGPGRAVAEAEVSRAHEAASGADGAGRFARAKAFGVKSWEEWGGGDDRLFVGYAPTKERGERAAYFMWYSPGPAGVMMANSGLHQGGDIDDAARRWDEESGVLNDPKWKTGAEARKALAGAWRIKTGTAGYEFLPDGTYKWLGTPAYTSTYRFADPQTLEIDGYDPFAKTKLPAIKYRVLVAGDEMYLVHQPDSARPMPVGPYARQ